MDYDCIVIGAGVVGEAIARELSRYDLKVAVLEKASDVCEGTSKANSGIVHAGFDAKPGTLKALYNVKGSLMMEQLSRELDFDYKRNGSLVLAFAPEDMDKLNELADRGRQNGVKDIKILTGEEVKAMEPALSDDVYAALYAPTGGIVCPFGLTLALAENACVNGVTFEFSSEVRDIEKTEDGFIVKTDTKEYRTRAVINAAGVYADAIHNMVCEDKINITARKGEYCLYDKKVGNLVSSTIFRVPGAMGKGILVTPTVHGNLLIGPTAEDTDDKENVATTADGIATVIKGGGVSLKSVPGKSVITSFAGLRAHSDKGDFIIGRSSVKGFYDAAGIESPGLSAAPAIGAEVAKLVSGDLGAGAKENFIATRKGIPNMAHADDAKRRELIKQDERFATVVCRCELVTEGEIVNAITRPLGATTLDGVKRRTRAGMGRCQSGFCSPTVMDILARELGRPVTEITKHGKGSEFVTDHK